MKPFRVIVLAPIMILLLSCIFTRAGTGGGTFDRLAGDPLAGLETLAHYQAVLTIATQVQTSAGPVDRTERYSLAVWSAEDAAFETIDAFDEAGQPFKLTLGKVGSAVYWMKGGESGCRVSWDTVYVKVDASNLSPYLYVFHSGTPAGDETVSGIASHVYQLDSKSIGIDDLQANGKVWIAASGGYLVKYHLELAGNQALFGPDGKGTETIDFALSEVNDGSPVAYPGDCLPVLADIPATEDAQDIQRLPGDLQFITAASTDEVQTFYEDSLPGLGWEKTGEFTLPDGEKDLLFLHNTSPRQATVILQPQDGTTAVEVIVPAAQSIQTPSSAGSAGGTSQDPSLRIINGLSKLLGDGNTPSVLPSFALTMNESVPTASRTDSTILQAEVQGANIHYILSTNDAKKETIHFDGEVYSVVNGKAQPASPMAAVDWLDWQLDPVAILNAAAMADITTQAGTTLEGRQVDVYSVDSATLGSPLPDTSMGVMPFVITGIQGTVWIDHDTGCLVKADLTFEADVKAPGESTPSAHGKGEFHFAVSQIGKVTVSLPK